MNGRKLAHNLNKNVFIKMSIKLSILVRRAWQPLMSSKVESIVAHRDVLNRNTAKIVEYKVL